MKIARVLDDYDVESVKKMIENTEWESAGTVTYAGTNGDPGWRAGNIAWIDHYNMDVDIHFKLLSIVPNSNLYVSEEWQVADYKKGDYFKKHIDVIRDSARRYTMVTMLDKSEDLKGGNLLVYINNEVKEVDLDIGQTIIFESATPHEVTLVEQGSRRTLVNWFRFRD